MRPPNGAPIYLNFMIQIALHGDVAEDALTTAHWNSPASRDVRAWLVEKEFVTERIWSVSWTEFKSYRYTATTRGLAWVEHACQTPLPVRDERWRRGDAEFK